MKTPPVTTSLVLLTLALAAWSVGCKPDDDKAAATRVDATEDQAKEAALDIQGYSFAQKAEFTETMRRHLAGFADDLDQLSAQVDKSTGAIQAEARVKLAELRAQSAKLGGNLDGARDATESTWADVKAAFRTGQLELKENVRQARQWLSDKLAP